MKQSSLFKPKFQQKEKDRAWRQRLSLQVRQNQKDQSIIQTLQKERARRLHQKDQSIQLQQEWKRERKRARSQHQKEQSIKEHQQKSRSRKPQSLKQCSASCVMSISSSLMQASLRCHIAPIRGTQSALLATWK